MVTLAIRFYTPSMRSDGEFALGELVEHKVERHDNDQDAEGHRACLRLRGNTVNMLTEGVELPAVYGASVPDMNTANLRTKGYELSISWRDKVTLGKKPLEYSIGFNLSDYRSYITKYDNKDKTFAKSYYEGMRLGEIWGFVTDGLFQTTEEAQAYAQEVDLSYINNRITGGWQAGDLKFVDLDGDGILGIGGNSVKDRKSVV